jgi:hypothetical protein
MWMATHRAISPPFLYHVQAPKVSKMVFLHEMDFYHGEREEDTICSEKA